MVTVKFGASKYTFDVDETLKTLTGNESILVEEYLGGWDRFQADGNTTRSTIVTIWLAKRSAGETVGFDEIADTPGLLFGGLLEITDDGDNLIDPDEASQLPLAAKISSGTTTVGENGS